MDSNFIKTELLSHIDGNRAFLPIPDFIDKIPFDRLGVRPKGVPYSLYELFHHVFFVQRDILEFIADETYLERNWPADYWPSEKAPKTLTDWENLKKEYSADQKQLKNFVRAEGNLLTHPVKHATAADQSLLREILLIIGHTAYHTGQMVVLMRLLDLYGTSP